MNNIFLSFLNKKGYLNERTSNAIQNIIVSFLVKGISIIVSLLLVPITINYINATQYGIWLTLSSIVAWFSFFDIGFGNGFRNRFAEAKATGDFEKAKTYLSTTYICISGIFSIAWLSFCLINNYLDWSIILNAPSSLAHELSRTAFLVFTFFCLQIILKTINIVLIADQKPAKAATVDMLGQVLALLVIYTLTKFTNGSLYYLASAIGFSPVLILVIATIWYLSNDYKIYKPSIKYFSFSFAIDILKLGSKFFFLQIAGIVIYQSTNIIITQIINPQSVTLFNIVWKYFNVAIMLSAIVFSPFWTAFTDAYKKKDYQWMKDSYSKLFKVSIILGVFVLLLLFFSSPAYNLWVGPNLEIPLGLSVIVAGVTISSIFASLHFNILNGMGKLKVQLIVVVIGVIINIPMSLLLGKKYGIIGVIIPSLIYNFFSCLIYSYQVRLLIEGKNNGIWNQ